MIMDFSTSSKNDPQDNDDDEFSLEELEELEGLLNDLPNIADDDSVWSCDDDSDDEGCIMNNKCSQCPKMDCDGTDCDNNYPDECDSKSCTSKQCCQPKCECGAEKVGSPIHSDWCPKYQP